MEQIPINSLSPGFFFLFIVIVDFNNSPCPPLQKKKGGGVNQAWQHPQDPDLA